MKKNFLAGKGEGRTMISSPAQTAANPSTPGRLPAYEKYTPPGILAFGVKTSGQVEEAFARVNPTGHRERNRRANRWAE